MALLDVLARLERALTRSGAFPFFEADPLLRDLVENPDHLLYLHWDTLLLIPPLFGRSLVFLAHRPDEWHLLLAGLATRLLTRRSSHGLPGMLSALAASGVEGVTEPLGDLAQLVDRTPPADVSHAHYLEELKKYERNLATVLPSWVQPAVAEAIRRYTYMQGKDVATVIVFVFTPTAAGRDLLPMLVPGWPAKLALLKSTGYLMDRPLTPASEQTWENSRSIHMMKEFRSDARAQVDLAWFHAIGVPDALTGCSGGFAQAALLLAGRTGKTLSASSCWIGQIHDRNGPRLLPVSHLKEKLEGLMEAGGYTEVFLAPHQTLLHPGATREEAVTDGYRWNGTITLRVCRTDDALEELKRTFEPAAREPRRVSRLQVAILLLLFAGILGLGRLLTPSLTAQDRARLAQLLTCSIETRQDRQFWLPRLAQLKVDEFSHVPLVVEDMGPIRDRARGHWGAILADPEKYLSCANGRHLTNLIGIHCGTRPGYVATPRAVLTAPVAIDLEAAQMDQVIRQPLQATLDQLEVALGFPPPPNSDKHKLNQLLIKYTTPAVPEDFGFRPASVHSELLTGAMSTWCDAPEDHRQNPESKAHQVHHHRRLPDRVTLRWAARVADLVCLVPENPEHFFLALPLAPRQVVADGNDTGPIVDSVGQVVNFRLPGPPPHLLSDDALALLRPYGATGHGTFNTHEHKDLPALCTTMKAGTGGRAGMQRLSFEPPPALSALFEKAR